MQFIQNAANKAKQKKLKSMFSLSMLFPDDKKINNVITYIETGDLPAYLDTPQKQKGFMESFKDFSLNAGKLIYSPSILDVIRKSDIDAVLKPMYDDPKVGVGVGPLIFYKKIIEKYLNITKEDVKNFLQKQPVFQVSRQTPHKTNRPLIATYANEIWAIDLIDMNNYKSIRGNKNFRFILTCIDIFSGYVWARALKTKKSGKKDDDPADSPEVKAAMVSIATEANIMPKFLLSDNGNEFKGLVTQWCIDNDIQQRLTKTYSPQDNAKCENFNRTVRKKLRDIFTREKSTVWIDKLNDICYNQNHSYHSRIKLTPAEVWTSDKTPQAIQTRVLPYLDTKKKIALHNYIKKVRHDILKNITPEFAVGDHVRILLSSLESKVRKAIKAGYKKYLTVFYTPTVFQIDKIVPPEKEGLSKPRYYIAGFSKLFFASELVKSTEDSDVGLTEFEAIKLNKVVAIKGDGLYFDI